MTLRVHYPSLEEGEHASHLRAALDPEVRLSAGAAVDPLEIRILVAGVPTPRELEDSPELHTLIIPWAGLPVPTRELMLRHPHIAVHNLHHNAAPVTEHAIGMLLAAARHLIPADRRLRQGDWSARFEAPRSPLLAGREALILGAGAVGTRLARACEGLAIRPRLLARRARPGVHGLQELDQLLPRAEVLFVALPGTPETEGLLDEQRLARLPHGALLVNVGRASVIDEAALYERLLDGRIAAAGLDVWYRYPETEAERVCTPPATRDFAALENVVMSPHRAGLGLATHRLRALALAELLNVAARGGAIPNRIEPARGY